MSYIPHVAHTAPVAVALCLPVSSWATSSTPEELCDPHHPSVYTNYFLPGTDTLDVELDTFEVEDTWRYIEQLLELCDIGYVEVVGHSDPKTADPEHMRMSASRAETVYSGLVGLGLPAHISGYVGKGRSEPFPVAPHSSQLNARTETTVYSRGLRVEPEK